MTVNWINEIMARGGRVFTDEIVRQMAAQHEITQLQTKRELEAFLLMAFKSGVGIERTSEIFLTRWERYRMPIYKDAYISTLYLLNP